jgi:hypothetical protein
MTASPRIILGPKPVEELTPDPPVEYSIVIGALHLKGNKKKKPGSITSQSLRMSCERHEYLSVDFQTFVLRTSNFQDSKDYQV